MENIEIIEYEPQYAESLAKMWNMSSENWGGYDHIISAEDVRAENKNTDHINIYLAVDKNKKEVVGYCTFSEYEHDIEALYIPLLNVRPDYQGKKIGKALVLKTVKRTIELGWPRLDLYTWAGNTKAVPLYKKCGFFWEKNDSSTHLMNFIPQVLNTEALSGYFENLDWYNDNQREIKIEPDGTAEDGYCHYEYQWSDDSQEVIVGIEKRGRGIRKIETSDYLIESRLKENKLVMGRNYEICYHIENKTGKELNIMIDGQSDKNISFPFQAKKEVKDSVDMKGEFYVAKCDEKQKEDKTHPAVTAVINIDGKKALFKTGIKPVFPLNINLNVPFDRQFQGIKSSLYLDLENNYKSPTTFYFNLPSTIDLDFLNNDCKVFLKAGKQKSIKIDYYLLHNCIYSKTIDIKAELEDGSVYTFTKKISAVFCGRNNKFGGETEQGWILNNGCCSVSLKKENNRIVINDFKGEEINTAILQPKLGLPFSQEFSQKRPEKVEYFQEEEAYCMRAIYESDDFPNIHLISIIKLYADGLVENYYKVYNMGNSPIDKDFALRHSFYHRLADTFTAYQDKILEIKGHDSYALDYWNREKISENWFYSSGEDKKSGVIWSPYNSLKFNHWYFSLDYNFAKLSPGEYIKTEPLYIFYNTFRDYSEVRKFALKKAEPKEKEFTDKFAVTINEGNPFIKDDFKVRFKQYRDTEESGQVIINSNSEESSQLKKKIFKGDNQREDQIIIKNRGKAVNRYNFKLDLSSRSFTRKGIAFNWGEGKIKTQIKEKVGYKIFEANNGLIKIKSAPRFAHSVYSLIYEGTEWLDSSFPEAGPKSWWNPWVGGLFSRPKKMRNSSLLEERSRAEFVALTDNFNNNWQGIKISTSVQKNKLFSGLTLNQYYLMAPDLPLVCITTELDQKTGRYLNYETFGLEFYLKPEDELQNSWVKVQNSNNEAIKYKAGRIGQELKTKKSLVYGGKEKRNILQVCGTGESDYMAFTDLEVLNGHISYKVCLEDRGRLFTPPVFLLITENMIPDNLLDVLDNISFN